MVLRNRSDRGLTSRNASLTWSLARIVAFDRGATSTSGADALVSTPIILRRCEPPKNATL